MYPAKTDYYRASTIREAIELLGQYEGAKILAGGHSLIPMLKLRLADPRVLIDIGRVSELKGVERSNGTIAIGALTTHAELAASSLLASDCPLLAEAASKIADPQVRNKGTIGGNLAHADPASDLPATLVALGAEVELECASGVRLVPAADFFVGLLTCDISGGELLTRIHVPAVGGGTGSAYLKVEHPASGYAICGAAAVVTMESGECRRASLAFNGVSATPTRAQEVASALIGTDASDGVIAEAVERHLEIAEPLGDLHASGEYRRQLARTYGRRALALARDRSGQH